MVRHTALALALLAGLAGLARANGRPAATSTINFRPGHEQDIAAGMTFGLLVSHDGGASWRWICELAVKYGGNFDPDYAYTASGVLFATTFDGSLVNRDGCTFDSTGFGKTMFSTITVGPDGALLFAASEAAFDPNPGDAKIYRSTDDGVTFPGVATVGQVGDWYSSIEVAPSDPSRVYLSGYRSTPSGRTWQFYRSDDGGATFAPVASVPPTESQNTAIDIEGISRTDRDTLFVVLSEAPDRPSSLYRSRDAGATWTKVLERPETISFVIRANGDLVAGTVTSGTVVSRAPSLGDAWEPVPTAPHLNCLVENTAGEVWACTQNYGSRPGAVPVIPSDGAGIMKTTDLVTWTPVLRYQDIAGPVECPVGTRQHDECVYDCRETVYAVDPATCPNVTPSYWCAFRRQLDITTDVIDCAEPTDAPPTTPPADPGCCDTGGGGAPTALLCGLGLAVLVQANRRRRPVRRHRP